MRTFDKLKRDLRGLYRPSTKARRRDRAQTVDSISIEALDEGSAIPLAHVKSIPVEDTERSSTIPADRMGQSVHETDEQSGEVAVGGDSTNMRTDDMSDVDQPTDLAEESGQAPLDSRQKQRVQARGAGSLGDETFSQIETLAAAKGSRNPTARAKDRYPQKRRPTSLPPKIPNEFVSMSMLPSRSRSGKTTAQRSGSINLRRRQRQVLGSPESDSRPSMHSAYAGGWLDSFCNLKTVFESREKIGTAKQG
jgi:hypothetical protein